MPSIFEQPRLLRKSSRYRILLQSLIKTNLNDLRAYFITDFASQSAFVHAKKMNLFLKPKKIIF
jgi:hypothetical protein